MVIIILLSNTQTQNSSFACIGFSRLGKTQVQDPYFSNKFTKIPKRETLGPFDWDLMGFIDVPLFQGQVKRNDENKKNDQKDDKHKVHHLRCITCGASPAVHHLLSQYVWLCGPVKHSK